MNKNRNKDLTVNYFDFVRWMKDHIPDGFPPDELHRFCKDLAKNLQRTLHVVKQAEKGHLAEHEAHVLEQALAKLAGSTRKFQEALDSGLRKDKDMIQQAMPPLGLNIERLRGKHLELFPLNVVKVTAMELDAYCFPIPDTGDDYETREWVGRVARTIWCGQNRKEEPASFYRFDHVSYHWVLIPNPKQGIQIWEKARQALHPDLGVLILLSAAANFGKTVSWIGVQNAFDYAVESGFIDVGKRKKYINCIVKNMCEDLRQGESVKDVLSQLDIPPMVVMDMISEVGVF